MNALILLPEELHDSRYAVMEGERATRFHSEQQLSLNQTIRVAVLGQFRALAKIVALSQSRIEIEIGEPLPARSRLPLMLFVAVPRPQTVKKVLSLAVQCGVSALYFVKSYHTIASYLQSHSLRDSDLKAESIKALSQVWDSHLPEITVIPTMAQFFNTIIPHYRSRYPLLHMMLAEPQQEGTVSLRHVSPFEANTFVALGIGPESGWSTSEKQGFRQAGFSLVHLDDREYRVETALALLLGQLKAFVDI